METNGKSESPSITVITVCLNAGDQLLATVESVLSQSGEDWEYLIKDGGSTDGSLEALPAHERIRVEVSRDTGIYDAMNQAVPLAKGRYVNFLNAGDRFPNGEILKTVSSSIRNASREPDLVYGDFLDERSAKVRKAASEVSRRSLFLSGICHQAQWIRREVFEQLGGFNLEFSFRADQELLLRLTESRLPTLYIPKVLALYDGQGFTAQRGNREGLDREWKLLRRTRYSLRERLFWGLRSALDLLWLKRFLLDTARRFFPQLLARRAEKSAEREEAS